MIGEITARELRERLSSSRASHSITVIDVRLAQIGTIPGARHVPVTDLEDKEWDWDPDSEMVVYCQFGKGGSDYAAEVLEEQGYRKVYKLVGGMDSWAKLVSEAQKDV